MNAFTRRDFLKSTGSGLLLVSFSFNALAASQPSLTPAKNVDRGALDSWLSIDKNGKITVYAGKVDLGTGVKTALAQIVSDELYTPFNQIEMIMGDTATTPDQWLTGAAISISQGGSELRIAAANAREALLKKGAASLNQSVEELTLKDGFVVSKNDPNKKVAYGNLIGDGFQIAVDPKVKLKNYKEYQVIGKSIPRIDIPEKVTGEFPYMHDFKLPGMVHARVIRSDFIGAKLESFDDSDAKKINGFLQLENKSLIVWRFCVFFAFNFSNVLK
jgi:CO/xanthine dehydrogenase Mo-binding subunit